MPNLKLKSGELVKIDAEDFWRVDQHNWVAHRLSNGRIYAARRWTENGKRQFQYLHRFITGAVDQRVGFINNDALDCRKKNLSVEESTNYISPAKSGAIGEAAVCLDLTRNGHECYLPFTGHAPADLVSCKDNGPPIRWQIKYRTAGIGNSIAIALQTIHPRKGGYERKSINFNSIDAYAIYNPHLDEVYYISIDEIPDKKKSIHIHIGFERSANSKFFRGDLTNPDRVMTRITTRK